MPYPNLTLMHWVPLLAASATLLAVLVALFRESFFLWWRRPQLMATIRSGPPDCNKTQFRPASTASTVDSYVFRLWVTNIGRTTATRVQVFAAELRRQHADGSFRREERFLPMNLLWSHIGVVFADGIAPQMGQHCDLGIVFPPTASNPGINRPARIPREKTCLQLETEVRPFTGSSHLEPGTYRLSLRIAASNVKPKRVELSIFLSGDWYDDEGEMLSRGIAVTVQ